MAGMQRFVTYIYAYDDGQKSGNAGYAKIEIRGTVGRIEIHFMGAGVTRGQGTVSFLYVQNERFVYLPLGEFQTENGAGTFVVSFQVENMLDTALDFRKIDGIYITDSNDRIYLSFWKDTNQNDFSKERFVQYSAEEPKEETSEKPEQQEQESAAAETDRQTEEQTLPKERMETQPQSDSPVDMQSIEDAEQESLHTMEIPMRNVFPEYRLEDIWEHMQKIRPCAQLKNGVCAIQIELKDLRELPKKYWYLGNNSFLLHGFFNYRHLIFGKTPDGKWFLGVPGVYQRQEHVMASIFGFPGFWPVGEAPETNTQPQNRQPQGRQPQNRQPQNRQPQNRQPQNPQPQNRQPQNRQPQNTQPQNSQSQNSQSQNTQPQNRQPQGAPRLGDNIREMQQGIWYHMLDD